MQQDPLFVGSARCDVWAKQQPFVLRVSPILYTSLPNISFPLLSWFFNCRVVVLTQLFPLCLYWWWLIMEIIQLRVWERGMMHFKKLDFCGVVVFPHNLSVALHHTWATLSLAVDVLCKGILPMFYSYGSISTKGMRTQAVREKVSVLSHMQLQ